MAEIMQTYGKRGQGWRINDGKQIFRFFSRSLSDSQVTGTILNGISAIFVWNTASGGNDAHVEQEMSTGQSNDDLKF